jgi:hypothetical protein
MVLKEATLFTQEQVSYVTLSTTSNEACANCIFYRSTGFDDIEWPHCHIVENYPEPIEPTGYCNEWRSKPAPVEITETPMPVVIVEPEIEVEMEASLFNRIWQKIQARLTPEKEAQAFTVFKDAQGIPHWKARYTNNFLDLDYEIISEKALQDDILRKDMGLVPKPELWDMHIPGTRHGQADDVFGIGHFVYALGHYDDTDMGRKAAKYDAKHAHEYELSHGFVAPERAFKDGIYEVANTFEITKLPKTVARGANPFTYFEEIRKMQLSAEREKHLRTVYGDETVDKIKAEAEKHGKALEELGIAYKDFADVTPKPAAIENKEGGELLLEVLKTQGEQATMLATLAKARKDEQVSFTQVIDAYKAQVANLTKEVDMLRETVNMGPRRPSQDIGTVVTDKAALEQAQKQAAVYDDFFGDMNIRKAGV